MLNKAGILVVHVVYNITTDHYSFIFDCRNQNSPEDPKRVVELSKNGSFIESVDSGVDFKIDSKV